MTEEMFIYALVDPRKNEEVHYVGKTIDPEARLSHHLSWSKKSNSLLAEWVNGLREEGIRPSMRILETLQNSSGENQEQQWMRRMEQQGHVLLNNHRLGKDGYVHTNILLPVEVRERLRTVMDLEPEQTYGDHIIAAIEEYVQRRGH